MPSAWRWKSQSTSSVAEMQRRFGLLVFVHDVFLAENGVRSKGLFSSVQRSNV